jgi:hypothetical protein
MNTLDLEHLEKPIERAIADFQNQHDVNQLLIGIRSALTRFIEELIVSVIQQLLLDPHFLATLKVMAGKSALRFNGYKPTSIRLLSGQSFTIDSPYFAKAPKKARRGRRSKKRKAKNGCHLGLAYLGFIDRCSGMLTSAVVQAALLCSFEIAKRTLLSFGIEMNIKTIQRLCMSMGNQAIENRHRIALSDADGVQNRTLFVCIDGGRLRERTPKRGRRPKGQKRQGYYTDWREPTQIVIQWLDTNKDKCKHTVPLYDATLGDIEAAFQLLEGYLRQMDASKADMVIFCADGARRYWRRFSSLAERLEVNGHLEIIDYTHAKQNLKLVAEHLPKKLGNKKLTDIFEDWKNLLWKGKLDEIHSQIRHFIRSSTKRKKALKKFKNYFLENYERMQYASFRHLNLPTGSGCVESAIRRVINLRLKSPGIFWKRNTAEVMLFLRSTLLCGRWNIMLKNLFQINRGQLEECH